MRRRIPKTRATVHRPTRVIDSDKASPKRQKEKLNEFISNELAELEEEGDDFFWEEDE